MVLQLDGSGNITNRYLQGAAIDQILADEDATGEVLWPLADNLGSVRDLVKNDGTATAIVNHIIYDAFGQIVSEENLSDPSAAPAKHIFGFTGRERDEESDYQYNRARYYDAALGQFLSEDPIGFDAGDANLRRYVGNGSTFAIDPSGLQGHRGSNGKVIRGGGGAGNADQHPLFLYFETVRKNNARLERRETRLGETVGKFDDLGRPRIGFIVERREFLPAPGEEPWYWTTGVYKTHQFVPRGVYWAPANTELSTAGIENQREFALQNIHVKGDNRAIEIAIASTESLYDFAVDVPSLLVVRVGGAGKLSREILLDGKPPSVEAVANAGIQTLIARMIPVSSPASKSVATNVFVKSGGHWRIDPKFLLTPSAGEISAGGIEPLIIGTLMRPGYSRIAVSPLAEGISMHGLWNLPDSVLASEISAIRSVYPKTGNFAFIIKEAENGVLTVLRSRSGQKTLSGLVGPPAASQNLFGRLLVRKSDGSLRPHAFDPETMMLEHLGTRSPSGRMLLYSENPICDGCILSIDHFEVLYPNVLNQIREGIPTPRPAGNSK